MSSIPATEPESIWNLLCCPPPLSCFNNGVLARLRLNLSSSFVHPSEVHWKTLFSKKKKHSENKEQIKDISAAHDAAVRGRHEDQYNYPQWYEIVCAYEFVEGLKLFEHRHGL